MAVQRFLPEIDRTRRAAGLIILAVGALAAAAVVYRAAFVMGRATVTTVVFIAVPAALAAVGARLAFRRELVVEIDLARRRYAVIRRGKPPNSGPLDDLGPLVVSQRTRLSGTGSDRRSVVEYAVNPSAHSRIDLYVLATANQARRKADALARAWRLPCRSLGGTVRAAEDLDAPLHERLRDDPAAAAAAELRPEWGLRVEPVFRGHAIVSSHRSYAPLVQNGFIAVVVLAAFGGAARGGLISSLRESSRDPLGRLFLGLMGVVALAMLWKLWHGVRDTFFPGSIRVTDGGVTYRGRRMKFADIEEVTAGIPIEVVGDRRTLALPASFCPPAAAGAVAHELQRLILEVAPKWAGG